MRRDEHLALLRARLAEVGGGAAAHGPSAALLHGLELAEVPGEPFIAVPVGRSRPAPGLRRTPLADSVVVAGTRCTPLLRTVADIARTRLLPAALVALDSSLRQRRPLPSQLRQAADAAQGNGRAQLRRAVPLADARAGSPIESLCRGHLLEASIGPVHTQSCLRPDGHAYDMRVRGSRLLIEADGRAFHDEPGRWQRDLEDGALALVDGYLVLRFSGATISGRSEWMVRMTAAVLHRYGWRAPRHRL